MSAIEYGLNYIKQHKILTSRKERKKFILELEITKIAIAK